MSLLDSIGDKLLNTKVGKKWAENSERQRILEILENGSKDELRELGRQMHQSVRENYEHLALQLFAMVFVWKPKIIRTIYDINETTNLCCEFQKQINSLWEQAKKISDNWDQLQEDIGFLGSDNTIRESVLFYANRAILLGRFSLLFISKEVYSDKFWDIIESEYGEDNTKDLREQYSDTIDVFVNKANIFNENGSLNEKISFSFLEYLVVRWELLFKFDAELANKYIDATHIN